MSSRIHNKVLETFVGNTRYRFDIGWTKFEGQDPYFSITGSVDEKLNNGRFREISGGMCHEDFEKIFPEYAHLTKYHLVSTKEPMHYVANAMYHASDKDHWGKRKGEEHRQKTMIRFNDVPVLIEKYSESFIKFLQEQSLFENLSIEKIDHVNDRNDNYKFDPKFTFAGFANKWHECPFDSLDEAKRFKQALVGCKTEFIKICVSWGEGKEPDLKAARASAVWPDADLSDFTPEKLKEHLVVLMENFKNDLKQAGIKWPKEEANNLQEIN